MMFPNPFIIIIFIAYWHYSSVKNTVTKCRTKLTKSAERDETSNHKHRMEVEVQFWIISPRESFPVEEYPEEYESKGCNQ